MNTIKTTVHNRRIELAAPEEIPDGTDVLVDVTPLATEMIGIDEANWSDSAEALADWDAWLKTIEPIQWTCEERKVFDQFDEAFRQFNLDAVRKQMEEGIGP